MTTDTGIRALHAHRLLMRLALGMVNVFVWIFLFEFFVAISGSPTRALVSLAIVYALAQAIALFLTPLSAGHLRGGIRRMMAAGTLVLAGSFVVLGAILTGTFGGQPTLWAIVLFAFLFGAYRALYWMPYRIQEALRGEPVSIVYEVLVALMPAVAGAAIFSVPDGGVRVLFGAASFLVISLIPMHTLPDAREEYSWHYLQTYRELLARRHRSLLLHGLFDGIQGAALFLVWPLAVFLIVGTSYLWLGIVMSATLLLLLLLQRPYQSLLLRWRLQNSALVHVTLAVSGWIFRLAAGSPFGIVFADSYAYLGTPRGRTVEALPFEQAADSASFIDEYSALKEIALALGRIALCLVFGLLVYNMPLPTALTATLVIAALSSGIAVLLAR
jgi:hypothetical protein